MIVSKQELQAVRDREDFRAAYEKVKAARSRKRLYKCMILAVLFLGFDLGGIGRYFQWLLGSPWGWVQTTDCDTGSDG